MIASYTGRAQLAVDDDEPQPVMVHIEVRRLEAFGQQGQSGWTGQVTAGIAARRLVGEKAELQLPNGRSGNISLIDAGGNFVGIGEPPM